VAGGLGLRGGSGAPRLVFPHLGNAEFFAAALGTGAQLFRVGRRELLRPVTLRGLVEYFCVGVGAQGCLLHPFRDCTAGTEPELFGGYRLTARPISFLDKSSLDTEDGECVFEVHGRGSFLARL
jgi:hypothetical protein